MIKCPYVFAVRSGFLHLAEALAYHRDAEVPLRAIIAMLKAGERCNSEAELIGKGISVYEFSICECSVPDILDSHQI